ncbi:hypothetical protein [Burkholderia cenocepacia]|uniref:hypothetical protein n=1 Tax=Burkholderia cenocepacia TaxID=95486 RepID=UPI001BAC251D|nr:hypothetical protein [Burkholderia cenocepacia]
MNQISSSRDRTLNSDLATAYIGAPLRTSHVRRQNLLSGVGARTHPGLYCIGSRVPALDKAATKIARAIGERHS